MEVKEISPKESYERLKNDNCVLIDVRTDAEFVFVGQVDLANIGGKSAIVPWKIFPAMSLNPRFQVNLDKELQKFFPDQDAKDLELIFMCRSGARSFEAAAYLSQLGYKNCYNLTSGFEGDANDKGHRSTINGWKAENLPWKQ